jgi:RNA polymerase sigma factor (sigma-70 family)
MAMETGAANTRTWQEFLDKAFQGDCEAFGDLCQRYLYTYLYAYALKEIKNSCDAEDVVQDVLEYLLTRSYYRTIRQRDLAGFTRCIRTITHNMMISRFRVRKRTRFVVTHETLTNLEQDGESAKVLQRLAPLQEKQPCAQQTFLAMLATTLEGDLTESLKARILRYSRHTYSRWHELSPKILQRHSEGNSVQKAIEQREIAEIFYTEIRPQLTEEEWQVFYHRSCTEGFTYQRYSEQTGIPITTLHSRWKKVRNMILNHTKLRAYWAENDKDFS